MAILSMSAAQNNVLGADDLATILFTGADNSLSFVTCAGASIIAQGTGQTINVSRLGADDNIIDLGHGLHLGGFSQMSQMFPPGGLSTADLVVWAFGNDKTGVVNFQTEQFGYTVPETITPDGRGGSWLNAGGPEPFAVHFMNDPVANLKAHVVVT